MMQLQNYLDIIFIFDKKINIWYNHIFWSN